MRISDWSSDVCSSDLLCQVVFHQIRGHFGPFEGVAYPDCGHFTEQYLSELIHRLRIDFKCFLQELNAHEILLREPHLQTGLGQKSVLAVLLTRSEEHTSELQSLMRISYAVFCLKKKKKTNNKHIK